MTRIQAGESMMGSMEAPLVYRLALARQDKGDDHPDTLEAMGEVDRLHTAVFRSYHVEDLYMSQEKVISEWAAKNGLDHEKFMAIYRSDETRKKVERARKLTVDYDIQGTPSLVVDGKYLTDGSSSKTIDILDRMVRIARQQREKAAKSGQ